MVEGGCGCALLSDVRFGCWVCTVVRQDRMPSHPILRWARQRILEVSRDPRYRERRPGGGLGRLNEEGRREVARAFLEVAERYPEALGYDDLEGLKERLRRVVGA